MIVSRMMDAKYKRQEKQSKRRLFICFEEVKKDCCKQGERVSKEFLLKLLQTELGFEGCRIEQEKLCLANRKPIIDCAKSWSI